MGIWFKTLLLPLLLFALPSLMGLSHVVDRLADQTLRTGLWSLLPDGDLSGWQVRVWVGLAAVFGLNQWITTTRPYRRFKRFEETKERTLRLYIEPLMSEYKDAEDIHLRVNVMLPSLALWWGWKSWPCIGAGLRVAFASRSMQHHSDADLQLRQGCGLAGKAYIEQEARYVDLTKSDAKRFSLTDEEVKRTEELKFVVSFPIRALDSATNELTARVVGVLNIDSRSEGAERLVQRETSRNALIRRAQKLSELCSHLY